MFKVYFDRDKRYAFTSQDYNYFVNDAVIVLCEYYNQHDAEIAAQAISLVESLPKRKVDRPVLSFTDKVKAMAKREALRSAPVMAEKENVMTAKNYLDSTICFEITKLLEGIKNV